MSTRGPAPSTGSEAMIVGGIGLLIGVILTLWSAIGGAFSPLLMLLFLAVGLGIGWLIHWFAIRSSVSLVGTILGAGNITPPPSYPVPEMLIARGKYADAAAHLRDYLRITPEDLEARLRLAALLEEHLGNFDEAEELYLEVRRSHPDRRREMAAYNGLIDLYTKLGRKDRLMVELARFADRYKGTVQAEDALRRLRELKADV